MPKLETRFFSLTKIPRPSFVTATFSYNYFVPDEAVNDTGISRYDNGQFKSTSFSVAEDGSSYITDDQGNKMILDNYGNLVSEDVLSTRSPRTITIEWTPPTQTATVPDPPAPSLSSLDNDSLIMKEEEISSVYDMDLKVFDPKLRIRFDEKLKLLAALHGVDPYTFEGLTALQDNVRSFLAESTDYDSTLSYYDNLGRLSIAEEMVTVAIPNILDMNKSAGSKRVNDLGLDVASGQFEAAATYVVDAKVDRRILSSATHCNIYRNNFSKRQLMRFLSEDASDKNTLPKEPDRIIGEDLTDTTRESTVSLTSPILVAQSVARPILSSDDTTSTISYAQTDLIGYIVERYRVQEDFSLSSPERTVYIDSPLVCNAIDTEILYGVAYYYTVRSVYMRESEVYDHSIEAFNRVRHYFACTATDPVYVESNESTPPAEPDGLFYKFNYREGSGLILTWQYPVGKQRDTKYFQIFRRSSVSEPFTCIAEIDFNNSSVKTPRQESIHEENVLYFNGTTTYYEDIEFTRESNYIYAVAAVDAHGLSSGYSAQTYVSFKKERNIIMLSAVSPPGAPKQYPNFFIDPELDESTFVRTLTQDVMRSSGKQKVKIYLDSDVESFIHGDGTTETHLGLSHNNHTYKIHFINLDRHKDESLEVRVTDYRES